MRNELVGDELYVFQLAEGHSLAAGIDFFERLIEQVRLELGSDQVFVPSFQIHIQDPTRAIVMEELGEEKLRLANSDHPRFEEFKDIEKAM